MHNSHPIYIQSDATHMVNSLFQALFAEINFVLGPSLAVTDVILTLLSHVVQ